MNLDWNFSKRLEAKRLCEPTYENIILGNSLSMDGINSELLSSNNSTYNLSIGGASIKTSYVQLKEYLNICKIKPKRVIIGRGSNTNTLDDENVHPIVEFTMDNYNYKISDLPLIKFKWIATELLKKIVSHDHRNATIVLGQLRINKIVVDNTEINNNPQNDLFIEKYINSSFLKKIVDMCNENEISCILIEMPGFRSERNNLKIGPHKLTLNSLTSVKLYNFNGPSIDNIINPNVDWLANYHLNNTGANKFTRYIRSFIIN